MTGLEQHECTNKFMELPLVRYRAEKMKSSKEEGIMSNEIRVLQEYQFNCSSTSITSLILGIDIERIDDTRNSFPSVQIFRTNQDKYTSVPGSERAIYYSTSNVSTTIGGYQYPLNPPIPVMRGDLLAVIQPGKLASVVRVYHIDGISFTSSQKILIDQDLIDLRSSPITNQLILIYPVTGKTHAHCIIELFYYH